LHGEQNVVGNMMSQVPLLFFCRDKAHSLSGVKVTAILTHAYDQL